ncbi:VTT domain-containing protein [Halorussus caseinilyticus]|uniref:VTT domain-containing protein n=1 Tax=Halorussus caseinilyticus TaxID=3034025 RepID=A0ABD5WK84_9EURY
MADHARRGPRGVRLRSRRRISGRARRNDGERAPAVSRRALRRRGVGTGRAPRRLGRAVLRRDGRPSGMVASRLAPAPSDPVSAAAGLSGVSTGAFVAGTAVGEVPWTVAAVLAGSSLDRLSTAGLNAIGWELLAAAAAVAVALLAGPAYRAASARR